MIFWTLIALVLLVTAYVIYREHQDSYGSPFVMGLVTAVIGTCVAGLVFLVVGAFMPSYNEQTSDRTHQLKALGNSSAIEGRLYFLGGGYVDDKRVLNFISQREGGAIHVEQAEAEDSTIYEGHTDATVQVQHYDHVNRWFVPFPIGGHEAYTFRIPSGSVVESYALDNK